MYADGSCNRETCSTRSLSILVEVQAVGQAKTEKKWSYSEVVIKT